MPIKFLKDLISNATLEKIGIHCEQHWRPWISRNYSPRALNHINLKSVLSQVQPAQWVDIPFEGAFLVSHIFLRIRHILLIFSIMSLW